jgi:hypothetical protein
VPTIAAENGVTTRQLIAMLDWTTVEMAEARAAEWKRLAGAAMALISSHRPAGRVIPCKFRREIKCLKIGW